MSEIGSVRWPTYRPPGREVQSASKRRDSPWPTVIQEMELQSYNHKKLNSDDIGEFGRGPQSPDGP